MENKLVYKSGTNTLHNEMGPAVHTDYEEIYYIDGQRHNMSGPAYIDKFRGIKEWYKRGVLHRIGQPAIIDEDGGERWLVEGKYHREDGPAITHPNGKKEWYINGQRHRIGGFAIENIDATKSQIWISGAYRKTWIWA